MRFDPSSPDVGPFPTDFLTVPDTSQKTGLRINLPSPDCTAQPSSCQDVAALNRLDGFQVEPRIRIRFSGAINPDSLRQGVYFVALDNLTNEEYGIETTGEIIPINEVGYDPTTQTGYAKPDYLLDQHRRFAIIVTDGVTDTSGAPVQPDPAFTGCVSPPPGVLQTVYCGQLRQVFNDQQAQFGPRKITGASVFTTMSATVFMENARAQLQNTNLGFQRGSGKSVFNIGDLSGITLRRQVKANSSDLVNSALPLVLLAGVGRIAFGAFQSPVYLGQSLTIADTPTGMPPPVPAAAAPITFHVYLPPGAAPASGYPVVIFGHGFTDSSFGAPSAVASTLAQAGFATVAINVFGHGGGSNGTVVLTDKSGNTTEIPTGGRGLDIDGDGTIDDTEGCVLPGLSGSRDCLRQTVVDLMQLVRVIQSGVDVAGDGSIAFDPSRIYYGGQSFGSIYGTILMAVEPTIQTAALNVGGGSVVEILRLSPAFHLLAAQALALRAPPLLNVMGRDFNDNSPLRYRAAVVNNVPGAIDIQNFFDFAEWYESPGDPIPFAPHLRSSTLPNVPIKNVLWQEAKGDKTVPNPASSNLVGSANMQDSLVYFQNDVARAVAPDLSTNPHTFLTNLDSIPGAAIALAAQAQIAEFLKSDGKTILDINDLVRPLFGKDLFVTPAFLPEDLNFQ
ncbi:MAG: alpha/beta hydrolase family protein [Bryobacteraceae bacterium]